MRVGVDEAGRGPLVGPMVMAAVAVDDESQLPTGVRDSKVLTPAQRDRLYVDVIKLPHSIRIVQPKEIDEWVAEGKLNWLEAQKTVEMLRDLLPERQKPDKELPVVVIDCPAKNLEEYRDFIKKKVPPAELIVEYKADARHPVAAAASILAKVTRDRLIEEIRQESGIDFGSGYPADPRTRRLFDDFNPDWPHYRKSWKPYKDALNKTKQRTLF